MRDLDEIVVQAIKDKYREDIKHRLITAPLVDIHHKKPSSFTVPLTAIGELIYEKESGNIVVQFQGNVDCEERYLSHCGVFTVEEFIKPRNMMEVVDYIFDNMKYQLIRELLPKVIEHRQVKKNGTL